MSTEMTEKAMAEAVKKINGLRRNATIYMTEFLRVLALDPANGVKERVQLYFLIAMNFRLIILKNNESREQNWSRAIPYMKKFVHAMKSDFAAYQEFGCKGTRENWIGNKTDVDSDEVLIEKLIQQYEKNAFYCKFNNYWNVVPINTRSA